MNKETHYFGLPILTAATDLYGFGLKIKTPTGIVIDQTRPRKRGYDKIIVPKGATYTQEPQKDGRMSFVDVERHKEWMKQESFFETLI